MGTPAEDAAFLARNAAESLPAGGLQAKLEAAAREGRQLRAKLGLDPTAPDIHLGHTVVLQQAARVPGPRPPRGPDRGRLHRARGRSERPLGDAAGALGRGDRRQRPHLPGAGLPRAPRRSRAARGALQLRVAGHAHGGALPPGAHDDRRPAARARRLRQALGRAARRSRSSSCSIRSCRATTRSPCAPTSSSAAPTRPSTCCSRATSSAPTASPSRAC